MFEKIYIQAMNVHQGGGLALLKELLMTIPSGLRVTAVLDRRVLQEIDLPEHVDVHTVQPTVVRRLLAEVWLFNHVKQQDLVLSFGNLPPLFALKGVVQIFVQNRYLVDDVSLSSFSLKTRFRLHVERFWLKVFSKHAQQFIVQTESMKSLLCNTLDVEASTVKIWPFSSFSLKSSLQIKPPLQPKVYANKKCRFIYAATGDPHKNHTSLIEAWVLLAKEGIRPHLSITLAQNSYPEIILVIDQYIDQYQLDISNVGFLSHSILMKKYHSYDALIYPSLVESYGLPLVEAHNAGLKIIASELDYVRDVVTPQESFDPHSSISIARAVKRFMGYSVQKPVMLSAEEFLNLLLTADQN